MKELKEFVRDPKMLIGMILIPALMFPLMGYAMRISMETAKESVKGISVVIMDFDGGGYKDNLTEFLETIGVTIVDLNTSNLDEAVDYIQQHENVTGLIVIPEGFSDDIGDGSAELHVYVAFRGKGAGESAGFEALNALIEIYKESLARNTFDVDSWSVVKGEPVHVSPSALFGIMMSQYVGMPIGIMMLLIFAMQIAATSVASEKEEKTLETLLTLPIGRMTILAGKLMGSVIGTAIGALAFVIGWNYYMGSVTGVFQEAPGVNLEAIGLAPTLSAYLLLGASLFVTLISSLALAVSISVFAEDVRSAQTMVSYVYIVIIFPMIFMMYADINALPLFLRLILFAIPYTHPMLAARAAFTEDYFMAVVGMVYVAIFTVVVLYIAARLFGTEKILTARLKFGRFRLRKSK